MDYYLKKNITVEKLTEDEDENYCSLVAAIDILSLVYDFDIVLKNREILSKRFLKRYNKKGSSYSNIKKTLNHFKFDLKPIYNIDLFVNTRISQQSLLVVFYYRHVETINTTDEFDIRFVNSIWKIKGYYPEYWIAEYRENCLNSFLFEDLIKQKMI